MKQYAQENLAAKTVERYHEMIPYLSEELLVMDMAAITPLHLSREWARLLKSGGHTRKTKEPRAMAPKTARNIAGLVSSAYLRPNGFAEALQHHLKATAKTRAVLTFPGNLVLCPDRVIAASQAGLRTIYLYASADYCITAFLNREQQNGRNLDLVHWNSNNSRSYIQMSDPAFAPYRIHVFTSTGTRRRHNAVFKAMVADGP